MAGLGVHDKISKINAELARLELEMELDYGGEGQCKNLGTNGSGWFTKWTTGLFKKGGAALEPSAAIADSSKFGEVLSKVCGHADIAATPVSVMKTPGVITRFDEIPLKPVDIWELNFKGHTCLIIFWASTTTASYAVMPGPGVGAKYTEAELPATPVWSDRNNIASKTFGSVMRHLYADILGVCDILKFGK